MFNKKILISLGLIFSSFLCFAESKIDSDTINFFTKECTHSVSAGLMATNYYDLTLYNLSVPVKYNADMQELNITAALNFNDITLQAIYAPTFFNAFQAGVELINHGHWVYKESFEHDLLCGIYFYYEPVKYFNFSMNFLYQLKNTFIFSMENGLKPLTSHNPAFLFNFDFVPFDFLDINFSLSSYTMEKFYLFLSPIFGLCVNYKTNEHLTLSVATDAQFVDFLTLSANFNRLSVLVSAEWRF